MLKKLSVLFMALTFLPAILFAQDKMVMRPDGKFFEMKGNETSFEIMKMKHGNTKNSKNEILPLNKIPGSTLGFIDTLGYNDGTFNTNFGLFGQDWMVQWFEAPADLTIKGFAFLTSDTAGVANGAILEGKIIRVNLTKAELEAVPVEWDGYYTATGNGYNDVTSFRGNPDYLGEGWVSITGDPEPFGDDIWSDGGFGAPITPSIWSGQYQWIQTNILFEPTVLAGEIFGIAYKNTGLTLDADRLGFMSGIIGYPGWKFYANGRLDPGNDYGWWSREYTWDYLVEVDITGDVPPEINSFTKLTGTISTSSRTVDANVTDANPGGTPGVDHVNLMVSTDGGSNWSTIPMTGTEPNYSADIQGYPSGTSVVYYLEAVDNNGNSKLTANQSYYVFESTIGTKTLVVFSGIYRSTLVPTGDPYDSYFGPDMFPLGTFEFDHDVWAYGPLEQAVVDNYDNIIEIGTYGPAFYHRDVIKNWINGSGTKNYFLAGQEWLGNDNGFLDQDYVAGDFEYDILGLTHSYNDVSYDGTAGQLLGSLLFPQAGSLFGDSLITEFNLNPTDSMVYDPNIYLPGTAENNWNDGFDALGDVEIDLKLETRGHQDPPGTTVPFVDTLNCGGHRVLTAGNKVAFFTLDPLAIGGSPDRFWYGFSNNGIAYQVLKWFGVDIVLDVESVGNTIPEEFSISQNYPNPFNPATTIKFAVPTASKVVLKVYDILGTEVATLVNSDLTSGNYEVNFDASKLASGVYVYTINAGSFTATKKMMLMK